MIERLRKRFIIITMISVTIVITLVMSCINISNYMQINKRADAMLQYIANNDGVIPRHDKNFYEKNNNEDYDIPKITPETPFSTRFFTVNINENGVISTIDTGNIAAITSTDAANYAYEIYNKGDKVGFFDIYRYSAIDSEDGMLMIFLDCQKDIETFKTFLINSIVVSMLCIVAVFILVVVLSKKAIRPIAESYEKQKRFITDAGHEIKTPLAIISANTEVIELTSGENEWTKSIQNQIERLTKLTSNLVSLARMDEEGQKVEMSDFSFSELLIETASPFEAVAASKNVNFKIEVDDNIVMHGNSESIRQLISILLDNAFKYVSDCGNIILKLNKKGKRINMSLYNDTDNIDKGNLVILFERFYRIDNSRNSEKGGYGIGLSIAKAIVDIHKGKIHADSVDGKSIEFTVSF